MKEEEEEILHQQFQAMTAQKQSMQLQMNELKRTLEELEKSGDGDELFEMVGQIMIKKSKEDIKKRLKEREEILEIHLKGMDRSLDDIAKKLHEEKKQ